MTIIRAGVSRLSRSPSDGDWLLFAFWADDAGDFDDALAAVKMLNRYQRRYLPQAHAWRVKASALLALSSRWPKLKAALADLGITGASSFRQSDYRHYTPPPLRPPASVAEAFASVYLAPGCPLELIAAARKVYARLYHPDLGETGDLRKIQQVNAALDLCEQFARQRRIAAGTRRCPSSSRSPSVLRCRRCN